MNQPAYAPIPPMKIPPQQIANLVVIPAFCAPWLKGVLNVNTIESSTQVQIWIVSAIIQVLSILITNLLPSGVQLVQWLS
jgi:hypothetical protein